MTFYSSKRRRQTAALAELDRRVSEKVGRSCLMLDFSDATKIDHRSFVVAGHLEVDTTGIDGIPSSETVLAHIKQNTHKFAHRVIIHPKRRVLEIDIDSKVLS